MRSKKQDVLKVAVVKVNKDTSREKEEGQALGVEGKPCAEAVFLSSHTHNRRGEKCDRIPA